VAVEREAEPEPVRFADMEVRHLPAVLEIERRSFPTPWSERAFLSELTQNAYAHYIVALRGLRVVGYGGMWLILDEAHITNLAVHPAERGRGLGERLLTELERRAAAHGCTRMTLEVRPSNLVAQALYRKHGFEPRGRRPGYYSDTREDAIIMWKEGLDARNPTEIKEDGD
jgi:ribosomal-protein-alanine N-acetyltransferase